MSSLVDCFNASTYWIGPAGKSGRATIGTSEHATFSNFSGGANQMLSHIVSERTQHPHMRLLFFIVLVSPAMLVTAQEQVAEPARWIPTRPEKIVFQSHGTAQILEDRSVQLGGDARWQESTLYFRFPKSTLIQEMRVELLPPTSSADPNRPRQRKRLILFDIKPHLQNRLDQMTSLEFSSCVYLGNADDESTANCIDSLTDTGWTAPAFTQSLQSHQLALRLKKPLTLDDEQRMALTFDTGGSPDLDVLSRLRVSFVPTSQIQSK